MDTDSKTAMLADLDEMDRAILGVIARRWAATTPRLRNERTNEPR